MTARYQLEYGAGLGRKTEVTWESPKEGKKKKKTSESLTSAKIFEELCLSTGMTVEMQQGSENLHLTLNSVAPRSCYSVCITASVITCLAYFK